MAGPSGIGAVQDYIRSARAAGKQNSRRDYLAAVRRENAKHGRNPDLVEFDCLFLCMACGYLNEPLAGDPMRSEARGGPRSCAMCGVVGLVDLRHTAMVRSLLELEATELHSGRVWLGKFFAVLGIMAAPAGLIALLDPRLLGGMFSPLELACAVVPLGMVASMPLVGAAVSRLRASASRRSLPRRWRMPRTSKRPGAQPQRRVHGQAEAAPELLRAPLSGRPCLAYEVAVRDDDEPTGALESWRLLEQDNVGFTVGELEVAPGEALLQLGRERLSHGTIGSTPDVTRRYLRMRGFLDSEDVHVYETILAPGAECEVSRRKLDAPVTVVSD